MANGGLKPVPGWVDQLADLFGWVAYAWLVAQAASWLGKDNFIVAIAMGLAAAFLFPTFVKPVKDFFKAIFLEVVGALIEFVEFFAQWLQAVAEHFGGNMLRAVIRIVALAAFMWIWNLAMGIPAIANLINLITETAGRITAWVNHTIDNLIGQILRLRDEVRRWVEDQLENLGAIGAALRDEILGVINQLFNGLTRELQELRYELVARFDIVAAAMRLEVEILGQRIRLIPREVLDILRARFADAAREEERRLRNAQAGGAPLPLAGAAPWEVADSARAEITAAILEIPEVAGGQGDPFEEELRKLVPQAPFYLQGWLDEQITAGMRRIREQPTQTRVFADQAIADLRAVLAGRPPQLPDMPRELLPTPSTPPPAPEP